MKQQFTHTDFVPGDWSSAGQKAKFANHFMRFVEAGFPATLFPKTFYRRLSNCFMHIAHYDAQGFYHSWFDSTQHQLEFLRNAVRNAGVGDPSTTYSDVERALKTAILEGGYIEKYERLLREEVEAAERAELQRLQDKYEART